MAPGLSRRFVSEDWDFIGGDIWREERKKAREEIVRRDLDIYASDVDPRSMAAARANAAEAGVGDCVSFKQINITDVKPPGENGIIIMNPPYGERIGREKTVETIWDSLKRFHEANPDWSMFIITPDREVEKKVWGRPADRRRKLYNGNIEVCYYQFHGLKRR